MRRTRAAVGSVVFFLLAPGTVAGLIPWWLTRWQVREPLFDGTLTRAVGALLILGGAGVLIHAFARFVVEGAGTPAPVAPTERLVVGGLYRYVRNPMYLAVLTTIVGEALALGQRPLVTYALFVWIMFATFVKVYEEPTLQRRYGEQYAAYRKVVPGWIPRFRRWTDGGAGLA
jgi:protein-S-isoprenylcysteine O-methyltransferase Ste14